MEKNERWAKKKKKKQQDSHWRCYVFSDSSLPNCPLALSSKGKICSLLALRYTVFDIQSPVSYFFHSRGA